MLKSALGNSEKLQKTSYSFLWFQQTFT